MVGKIKNNPVIAAQQAQRSQQTDEAGRLGGHSVRQGRSPFAAVRNAFLRVADYISAGFRNFKSLFSRPVRGGEAGAARAAAAREGATGEHIAAQAQGGVAGEQVGQGRESLALEKTESFSTDLSSIEDMFEYEADKETGLAVQMMKDLARIEYTIGGKGMECDPERSIQALHDLVRDENGKPDEKMLLAVSQVAHQGVFADGESRITLGLMHEHGVLPVGKGEVTLRIELERLDNGDVRIHAANHNEMRALIGSDGRTRIPLKEGSFYEHSRSVTLSAESVAAGQPAVTATPVRYAYSLNE